MNTTDNMTKRAALFQHVKYAWYVVFDHSGDDDDADAVRHENYIRVSEWVDITFAPLTKEQVAGAALASIAAERAKVVEEFTRALAGLDERAANFRALSAPEQVQP